METRPTPEPDPLVRGDMDLPNRVLEGGTPNLDAIGLLYQAVAEILVYYYQNGDPFSKALAAKERADLLPITRVLAGVTPDGQLPPLNSQNAEVIRAYSTLFKRALAITRAHTVETSVQHELLIQDLEALLHKFS
jgi:hypothetical protein